MSGQDISDSISPSPEHDRGSKHQADLLAALRKERAPETGEHILYSEENFKLWSRAQVKHLSCSGKIGSGKTTIAATVIDHLSKPQNAVLYFFFEAKSPFQRKPVSYILGYLLRQLFQVLRRSSIKTDDILTTVDRPITGILESLKQLNGRFRKARPNGHTFLILDAYDEFPRDGSEGECPSDLIARLAELDFQVMVTFRLGTRDPLQDTHDKKSLRISATCDDLKRYIRRQPGNNPHKESYWRSSIAPLADGIFLAAAHVEGPLGASQKLAKRYEMTMHRIAKYDKERKPRGLPYQVLYMVYDYGKPISGRFVQLTLATLAGTEDLDEDTFWSIADLVEYCEGLVVRDAEGKDAKLSFTHPSLNMYFYLQEAEWFSDRTISQHAKRTIRQCISIEKLTRANAEEEYLAMRRCQDAAGHAAL